MGAKIISLFSGKGGTGKSTCSVFIGEALAARAKKVLVIELDSGLRSVDIISGVVGKTVYDISDILAGRCEADKAIVASPHYQNMFVVCAPYSGGSVSAQGLAVVCAKLSSYFDFIIIDTAAGMGDAYLAAKAVCNEAIVLVTPTQVSLRDGRIVADDLLESGNCSARLLINGVSAAALSANKIANLDHCIDVIALQLLGAVPQSDDIQRAAAGGEKLPIGSVGGKAFANIAQRLCGIHAPMAIN